jgi:hypothetical protein
VTLSPAPPLLAILLLAALATAEDLDKDTLAGMDAEAHGNWVEAAQAFARASEAAPGDTRRALRLRYARQRGIAVWKPQIDQMMKEKRFEDAARAVAVASLIDPDHAAIASAGRTLEKAGVKLAGPAADEKVSPLFPGRSAAGRMRCWSTVGPSFGRASKLIDGGVRFLIATQDQKGFWDSDKHGGQPLHDVGVTGLALLVLLVDGPGGLSGDRAAAAQRAVDYLVKCQDKDGVFGTRATHSFMYSTTLATEALAEYAVITGETERLRGTLERSRDFIVNAQSRGAGWRYDPGGNESDTSVTGRAVYALHALRLAGIEVPDRSLQDALAWVDSMVEPNFGLIGYTTQGGACARPEGKQETFPCEYTNAMTAAGMLVACYAGAEREWMEKSLQCLAEIPPQSRYADMYYWQVGARAYVAATGSVPASWYSALVNSAVACVRPDGGMAACDAWGSDGGRIYATAMTVLALAASYSEPAPEAKSTPTASLFLREGAIVVAVPASAPESPTGIYADPGMRITVSASGTIQPWVGSPRVACDGIKHELRSYKPLVKGAPFGCLLGKVGPEGKPFRIQESKPVSLSAHGQLFLLTNDERPEDGSGAWSVRIQLDR